MSILPACMSMLCPEEGIGSPGTGVPDDCESPCGFWESNLVTQEEQTVLLATATSFWLPDMHLNIL